MMTMSPRQITILHRSTGVVIYTGDHASLRDAVVAAAAARVNLSCADFERASLRGADLTCANLRGADLRGAVLRHARLTNADLRGAIIETGNEEIE